MGLDLETVEDLDRISRTPASLDALVGDDGGTTLGDLVDAADPSPEDIVVEHDSRDALVGLVDRLTDREAEVIRCALRAGARAEADLRADRRPDRRLPRAGPPDRAGGAGPAQAVGERGRVSSGPSCGQCSRAGPSTGQWKWWCTAGSAG